MRTAVVMLALAGCGVSIDDAVEVTDSELSFPTFYSSAVAPIDWSRFTSPPPSDWDSMLVRTLLVNTNRYSLSTYWTARGYDGMAGCLSFGGTEEENIRAPASVAFALAVSLKLGAYDEAITDVPAAEARAKAIRLTTSLACRHRINMSGGWGYEWQSPLWALYAGTAGWLLWDDLSATDRELVRKMVEAEGRRLVGYDPLYYRYADGSINYNGDSKAEEDAWHAQFLYLATNMMPSHPLRKAWEFTAAELAAGSHAMHADLTSNASVGGRPLRYWLWGSNVNADGAVVNHYMVHPDYMATAAYTASAPLWYGLHRQPTPTTSFVRIPSIYEALVEKSWTLNTAYPDTNCWASPCNCYGNTPVCAVSSPGGTIYKPNSPAIYFPHNTDWGTGRRANYVAFDVIARHFGLDTLAAIRADEWERWHVAEAVGMQNRSADRRTYISSSEDSYPHGKEEWVAAHAALAYFTKWIVAQNAFATSNAQLDIALDDQDREFTLVGSWTSDQPAANDQFAWHNVYAPAGGSGGTRRARWKPTYLPAGKYKVSAWWSAFGNHATDAPYDIFRVGGVSRVRVDQRQNGGRWVSLGIHQFDGTANTGFVELSNQTSTGYVVADGVMFERVYDDVLAPP